MKNTLPSHSLKNSLAIVSILGSFQASALELGELTGAPTATSISDYLTVSISGNSGSNPDNTGLGAGYWTNASDTTNTDNPTAITTSFTFTATGLTAGQSVDITQFDFFYIRGSLNGSSPIMNVFVNSDDLGLSNELVLTVDDTPESAVDVAAHKIHKVISLENGESVTIGFAYSDRHGLESRTHLIDNFTLSGDLDLNRDVPGIDLNNNGVSDIWENFFDAESLVADEISRDDDFDRDGVSNYVEFLHGTNPADPSSFFSLTAVSEIDGLVAHWGFDEINGAIVSDGSGNNNNGTLIGNANSVNGKIGGALEFNGDTAPAYVELPESVFGGLNNQFSIAMWVNGDALLQPRSDSVFAAHNISGGRVFNIHLPWRSGSVFWDAGGDRVSKSANAENFEGSWNHWVFTKNAVTGTMQIYLNGELWHEEADAHFGTMDGAVVGSLGSALKSLYYEGTLDEVFMFDQVLSVSQIQNLMTNSVGGLNLTTVAGKQYQLFTSEDLSDESWKVDQTFFGDGGSFALSFQPDIDAGFKKMFYRVGVEDVDEDNDGLTRFEESFFSSLSDNDATSTNDTQDYDLIKRAFQSLRVSELALTINNGGAVTEGNALTLSIERSSPLSDDFLLFDQSFSIQPTDGFSTSDYVFLNASGGTVIDSDISFSSGVTTNTITFQALNDNLLEADEEVRLFIDGQSDPVSLWVTTEIDDLTIAQQTAIAQAGHFLSQASMGGTRTEIADLARAIIQNGYLTACEDWIDAQVSLPRETSVTDDCLDFQTTYLGEGNVVPSVNIQNFELVWWGKMVQTEEQLRHRFAYSLSQIFVTSSAFWANSERNNLWRSYTTYYDKLTDASFGNYRDLLSTISYDPFMGVYLSSAYNQKEDIALGTSPDENYAREVMQLFSCGVYSQDQNGNYLLSNNERIENYDNDDITELAQVFTGLVLADENNEIENLNNPNINHGNQYFFPMKTVESRHDTSTKILLDGTVLSAGQSVDEDISDSLDVLATHPSTAPHLSRLLIKRMTSSNPSPAYIGRVTEAWRGEGQYGNGQRGNFVSIIKAILLDPEARNALSFSSTNNRLIVTPTANQNDGNSTTGRIKEPILKWTQFYRYAQSLGLNDDQYPRWDPLTKQAANDQTPDFGQIPMRAPSVFNFYASEFSPSIGALADAEAAYGEELTSPESEILTPFVIRQFEEFYDQVNSEAPGSSFVYDGDSAVNFSTSYHYLDFLYDKHTTVEGFLDDINLWFCNGQLSNTLRNELVQIANTKGGASIENYAALLSIIFNSSDFSVAY